MPERSDFWSRRRARVAQEDEAAEKAREKDAIAQEQAAFEAQEDETILQALGLPDPETLTPKDAAAFMARAVPARLRRRAMRALFKAHPSLSMPDGLQDYDDDYTVAPPDLRPMIAKWEPVIRNVSRRAEAMLQDEALEPEVPVVEKPVSESEPEVEEPEDMPRPRRMVFHTESDDA
ncbi:hypothetical protein PARPLA_01478 [Rhodobacteraceae bacterium THAF1]|uniref:DUF3306 domain-containing protein n=1 Tax=Palleronia sp. THAF1 TaxID=2587842 RepID=UPI000F3DDE17|nr:DUF3306 domain-containing protein [Palleronia sp. THAF1]QFU07612.1 hypothetical protein FIU81_02865 [Palleronia sp. THAF1]VDC22816.1 hypothetical protein PARPLA_01478 [Rhodobacteraceae bacterium THAF1]